jgi:predicted GH43/DUF377 family glycosyl hydrolase
MGERAPAAMGPRLTRRKLVRGGLAVVGASTVGIALGALGEYLVILHQADTVTPIYPIAPGWRLSSRNPVLDVQTNSAWDNLAVFDPCVVRLPDQSLGMWYSMRGEKFTSIGYVSDASGAGERWSVAADPVLGVAPAERLPYTVISRPSVLRLGDIWHMWYSTSDGKTAWIGAASSSDGIQWTKHGSPVLLPEQPWERSAVQCPNVLYDPTARLFRMWYSGGDLYEPDAVGYATSRDGLTWQHGSDAPIYTPSSGWEDYKIGSFQVHSVGDWHIAFYNAFQQDPLVSRIGMARSQDGVTGWQRHPANPILSPGASGSWNARMMYKPTALWDQDRGRWDVWFNASGHLNGTERIGHAWNDRLW